MGTEAGISSSSPIVHFSSAPVQSVEPEGKDNQPLLTSATFFATAHLAKVADLRATKVKSFVPKIVEAAIVMSRLKVNIMT